MLQSTQESGRKSISPRGQVRISKENKKRLSVLSVILDKTEGELVDDFIQSEWDKPENQNKVAELAGKEGA